MMTKLGSLKSFLLMVVELICYSTLSFFLLCFSFLLVIKGFQWQGIPLYAKPVIICSLVLWAMLIFIVLKFQDGIYTLRHHILIFRHCKPRLMFMPLGIFTSIRRTLCRLNPTNQELDDALTTDREQLDVFKSLSLPANAMPSIDLSELTLITMTGAHEEQLFASGRDGYKATGRGAVFIPITGLPGDMEQEFAQAWYVPANSPVLGRLDERDHDLLKVYNPKTEICVVFATPERLKLISWPLMKTVIS